MKRLIMAVLMLVLSVGQAAQVELLQSSIVDSSALNFSSASARYNRNINGRTYQRDPMVTFKGYQYAVFYNENRRVCIGRRKLPSGGWNVITFTDYRITNHDSHNVATIGICEKDGTIHLAFDHHKDPLHYRVSDVGVASDPESVEWSTDLFGAITDRLGSAGAIRDLTYPTFFSAPNGNLMLYYRLGGSGNGDGMIQEYNGTTHDWTAGLGKFISKGGTYSGAYSSNSTSRNPYINGISYGGSRLHASWGWRETSASASSNHDLNYAYSDDNGRTWYNSAGTKIGTTGSSYISINSPGLIVADIPQNKGLSNQFTHYAFADGSCHVMVYHNNSSGSRRYHHYWRNAAGVWDVNMLSFNGSRPKLVGDDDGNLFLVYVTGGKPTLAKGVPNASQTDWSWSKVYTQNGTTEGGEGKLDYTRWEQDRVLSFFGQKKPSDSGETPSALHVFDYRVSTKATQPVPAHGASVQELDAGLRWSAGLNANTHRVYFGTDQEAVASATTASPEYQGQQSGTHFMPPALPADQGTYYWRVDEVQSGSTVIPGLVWAFTMTPREYWSPVAHWSLDEGAGTVASDVSGSNHDGSLDHGASWGSDAERSSYVAFDGTDDRISTPFTYALSDSHDFTWAWWANKQAPVGTDDGSVMVGCRYGNTGDETYEFIKFTPVSAQFANSDGTASIERYDYEDIPQGEWHHYAMVKSGTNYQWYVDGVAQGDPQNLAYSETTPIPFRIGGDIDGKANECFNGFIDDVVLYRRALTAAEIENVQDGIYTPIITMVALGAPVDLTDAATWSDGLPAHTSSHYLVPDTGNLRSENGTSLFPGTTLTVAAGGKFQIRAQHEAGETTTVNNLFAVGGSSELPVNLAAGTGNDIANHLGGTLQNEGFTSFTGYGSDSGIRNILVSSLISGDGTLQSTGSASYPHTCTIANADNTFSGVWESAIGTLAFENAGAVGEADINVLDSGKLRIEGDWATDSVLTVADQATVEVDVGSYVWVVSELIFGGAAVEDGMYTTAELNTLGAHPVFSGSGKVRVGPPPTYELIAGWDIWNSATAPDASVLATGVTASAATSTEQVLWNTTDDRGASIDGTWGSVLGPPAASMLVAEGENLTLPNATSGGAIRFLVTNNSASDIELDGFHFDAYAFREQAPRTYELSVLAGGGISEGIVFTSPDNAIREVGGANSNEAHDDIDITLSRLADTVLGAGESVEFLLSFSGGTGDGTGGHHLFVDNVGITGAFGLEEELPQLEYSIVDGNLVFEWTGDGLKVQTCTNLIDGVWFDYVDGSESPVTVVPTNGAAFFRLLEQ